MLLEIIASNTSDIIAISKSGADRIELCTGMADGGLTPSYGLIEAAVERTEIPVNVIIRPHSQSFYYEEAEVETMRQDIRMVKKLGANGIVIGALTEDRLVDTETLKRLLAEAEGLDVTFHRAFDDSANLEESLETLLAFRQIKRILTAGGKKPVHESAGVIKKLMELSQGSHIRIMPGYGLQEKIIPAFIEDVRPEELHIGSGVRKDHSYAKPIDPVKLERARNMTA